MEEEKVSLKPAILVRGVSKQYGKENKVLDQLDMTVIKGTIYALLGASGCGKTTLLGSILGSRKTQNGSISILEEPPGVIPRQSIGFMPQDIALVGEMTIKNVLEQQGWIFGMTNKQIEERHNFIEKLLDLPPRNKLIKHLSGGQQRRVSLAVVLIQDPELLILDEPTVGLDPILRQNLWDYLIKITKEEKKTVVITTHYIEEARQADMVGMMRKGKILVEGEPQRLMNVYNYNSLEDLFTSLSAMQENRDHSVQIEPVRLVSKSEELRILNQKAPEKSPLSHLCFTNRGHAKALFSKNFLRYVRHPGTLIIALIFPILQISAVFIAIRVPDDMKVGIVNQELGNYSSCQAYVNDNNTIGGYVVDVDEYQTCVYEGLGCKFLEHIQDAIPNHIYFQSMEGALQAVKEGQIHQILFFPHNFSDSFMSVNFDTPEPGDYNFSDIVFYRDEVVNPLRIYAEKELHKSYLTFLEDLSKDCQWNQGTAKFPIRFNKPVYGKPDLSYGDFIAPGMMSIVVLGLANALAILTIISERNGGVWERTIVSGVKPVEILIVHMITLCFTSAIQTLECFLVPQFVFGLECKGNIFEGLLLVYSQAVVGVALGILISVFSQNEIDAIFAALGISLPFFMLSGFFWPLEGMPVYLRYFSYALPPTVPTESLNNIVFRGWGISNFAVYKGLLVSSGYVCVLTILSILGLKFEKK